MAVMLRPFLDQDAGAVLAVANSAVPFDLEGNEYWLRLRRQFDAIRFQRRHYVAFERETQRITGYGAIEQGPEPEQFRLLLIAALHELTHGVGEALYGRLMDDLRVLNAEMVWIREHHTDQALIRFVTGRGFVQTRFTWDLRLSLETLDLTPLLPVIEQVAARGVVINTVLEERRRNPQLAQHLHELYNAAQSDAYQPLSFQAFAQRMDEPAILPNCFFLARQGEQYIGLSALARMEAAPEQVVQQWTGVRPEFRRQGIATALRVCTIEAAQRLGYRTMFTYTDHSDPVMLAFNEKLGFTRRFGLVTLEKTLTGTGY
jgi:mycothiol synthase